MRAVGVRGSTAGSSQPLYANLGFAKQRHACGVTCITAAPQQASFRSISYGEL